MADPSARRDYSLTGRDAVLAVAHGLSEAPWYTCPIPRRELKDLMRRRDGPALRDTALWVATLVVSGALGWRLWGTWWQFPALRSTAWSTARRPTAAGTSAATAPPFGPRG